MEVTKMKQNRRKSHGLSPLVGLFFCLCLSAGSHLPEEFNQICRVEDTLIPASGPSTSKILCNLGPLDTQTWRLDVLRNWTMALKPESEMFSYEIICSDLGGNISLPLPIKCPGLISLTIRNCKITDGFSDFENPIISTIPSTLTKLEIYDSAMIQKKSEILEMFAKVGRLTKDYECMHPETIEKIIYRNVSYVLDDDSQMLMEECFRAANVLPNNPELSNEGTEPPLDMNVTVVTEQSTGTSYPSSSDVTSASNEINSRKRRALGKCDFLNLEKLMSVPNRLNDLHFLCDYEKLLTLEDSSNSVVSALETRFLEKYNRYPSLQLFNYSNNNIEILPPELSDWSFFFYDIRHIDLSNNHIKSFSFRTRYTSNKTDTYINLQNNNITTLTAENLENFKKENNLLIDVKNNPIFCDCDLKDLVQSLPKAGAVNGPLKRYGYLNNLQCVYPAHLAGRTMESLTLEELGCAAEVFKAAFVFVIIGVVMFILVLCAVVLYIYRKEFKGLLRSRCHKEMKPLESTMIDTRSEKSPQTVINMSADKHSKVSS